jgi:hypothetical protein
MELSRSQNNLLKTLWSFPHSRLITVCVTRLTRRVPLVESEQLTLPEHLSSLPVFSGVRVTRSLVLYVCVVDRCLSFCTFSFGYCVVCSFGHCVVCSFGHCVVCSFGHCVVCSSSIYWFWLPLCYLQTLLACSGYSSSCILSSNIPLNNNITLVIIMCTVIM